MTTTAQYLTTLRRIPDDIILSIASRAIQPAEGEACICGWAVREAIGRAVDLDAEAVDPYAEPGSGVVSGCIDRFGGNEDEWGGVFGGIVSRQDLVEDAFVTRVMEAAGVA
jgi:hypothetical protein